MDESKPDAEPTLAAAPAADSDSEAGPSSPAPAGKRRRGGKKGKVFLEDTVSTNTGLRVHRWLA
jgi:hypothetical protein